MIETYFYLGVNITYYCTCTIIIGPSYPLKVKNSNHILLELPISCICCANENIFIFLIAGPGAKCC